MEYITIVKSQKSVQAALFAIEGEILNVIVKDPTFFILGEEVECRFGDSRENGSIVKKDDYNLYLYIPFHKDQKIPFKRTSIRCPIHEQGVIKLIETNMVKILRVEILDISSKGIAFYSDTKLAINQLYIISFPISSEPIQCKVIIKNEIAEEKTHKYRYGCLFEGLNKHAIYHIRRYILNAQLITI
ncbi:PilZ domain-containing protein [Cytobacillus spongiae]|jgi:hypothetical protein|uniref:PilZ domain-containing protein n=1 Tax=Cytobacillus spongiae TaxID=2901381 RepID=UPI001F456CF0|nr:PilZ domain-containing protein [Cytobacillus spongiae]UII57172.1 PilZ domain-containing protein [Cytobacillus spongiae]